MTITVAVDAMGGDVGLKVTVPASIRFLQDIPDIALILVGDSAAIEAELSDLPASLRPRVRVHHATEVVGMDESPQLALKNKKDSSMRVAINLGGWRLTSSKKVKPKLPFPLVTPVR